MSAGSRKKRTTIKDVALAANVSPMTVSNVINNNLQYVSPITKERVEREIQRLDYRRQSAGRTLRTAEQRSIGLIVVSDDQAFLEDQFSAKVAAGLANVANSADYTMTVQGVRAEALSQAMIMRSIDVAGICAMISGSLETREKVVEQLHRLNQPLILFQHSGCEDRDDICTVRLNDRLGGELIGAHLVRQGAKSILALRPKQQWYAIDRRFEGINAAIDASGGDAKFTIIEAESESLISVQTALITYLNSNPIPNAIVGGNDQIALAAMLLLIDKGLQVPGDVKIAGFNGFEAHRYLRPQLTTVLSPAYEMGEHAGRLMLERLAAGSFSTRDLVLPVVFSLGGTTQ